jgi:DNA replication protein DnaC
VEHLPPLPPTIRPLSDPEYDRLREAEPGLWSDPRQSCLTCRATKVFLNQKGQETACDCMAQWSLHRYLLNAGIGTAYQRLGWDDAEGVPGKSQMEVLEYCDRADQYVNVGLGLVLTGQTGTGKTLLAILLLKRLLADGYDGYFTQFNLMLDSYTTSWRNEEEYRWFTRRVRNAAVLVVDDIGKEAKGRENVTGSMFDTVIRSRVASARPTIITTNYTMAEMRQGYGGAVMSLLAESSKVHEVTGPDYRETAKRRLLDDIDKHVSRPFTLG